LIAVSGRTVDVGASGAAHGRWRMLQRFGTRMVHRANRQWCHLVRRACLTHVSDRRVVRSRLTNENGPPTVANGPFSLYAMRGHITSLKAGRKSPQRTRAEEAKLGGTSSGRQYPPEDTNCRVSLTVRPARERDQGSAVANRPLGESVFPAQHHSWFRSQIRSAPVTGRSAPAAPVW
jgi:hypothetical protein